MHDRPKSTLPPLPPRKEMYRYSETTRRQLYDRIAEEHFPIPSPEQIENARIKDEYLETRSAEQAGLMVVYVLGRWFALWRPAEPPAKDAAERDLWEVVSLATTSSDLLMAEV